MRITQHGYTPLCHPEILQREQPSLEPKPRPVKPREDYESSGGESEDDYVQSTRPPSVGKARKRVSKRSSTKDGGEPKAQRKRKRQQPVEVDLTDLPPEQGERPTQLELGPSGFLLTFPSWPNFFSSSPVPL